MESINSAYNQANLLYDIEIPQEQFEELALIAWNKIGNRQTKIYRYSTDIDKETLTIELPCNCFELEAVTYNGEDWNYTSRTTDNGDFNSMFIENYIESRKIYNNPLYINGKFAKYERVNNTLYFDKDYGHVNILYKGIIVDEDGLPFINEKEKDAIACYIGYTLRFKEGWKTHNQAMLQEAQLLEQKWLKLCDAARVSIKLSQNEINEILDAKSSWNRKVFNKSLKLLK